jgi:hypothetical protein
LNSIEALQELVQECLALIDAQTTLFETLVAELKKEGDPRVAEFLSVLDQGTELSRDFIAKSRGMLARNMA